MIRLLTNSIFLFIFLFPACAGTLQNESLNFLNDAGKRTGYWILDENNNSVSIKSTIKHKEGMYRNGRKYGVWITYFNDGKTPRIIGEYSDNRPSGAFFRFNSMGQLVQVGSTSKNTTVSGRMIFDNNVFKSRINFHNGEVIAGEVFFTKDILKRNQVKFWNFSTLETISRSSEEVAFSWLEANYERIYAKYIELRTPNRKANFKTTESPSQDKIETNSAESPKQAFYYPPLVKNPKTSVGKVFNPNGFNTLYTKRNEIWIDGYFKNGQLTNGKAFIYDDEGVLIKMREYRDGVYASDGVL